MGDDAKPRRPRRDGRLDALLEREHVWSLLACLAIVAIGGSTLGGRSYDYELGEIVEADIVAPADLRVPDPESTERRREAARTGVLEVYDLDPFAWREPVASLNDLYVWGREQVGAAATDWSSLPAERRTQLNAEAETIVGLMLPDEFLPAAWEEGFTADTELGAENLLRERMQRSLLGSTEPLTRGRRTAIRIRDIGTQQERVLQDLSAVMDLDASRQWVRRQVQQAVPAGAAMQETLAEALARLLRPNLTYNSNETQARRQAAAGTIAPAFYQVRQGRTIAREGDPVSEQVLRELAALQAQIGVSSSQASTFGMLLLTAIAILAMWRYVRYYRRRNRVLKVRRLYHLLLLVLVGSVLVARLMLFVGAAVAGSFAEAPFNVVESYPYAVPFAVGALLLVLLVEADIAWIYAAVQAVVLGVMTGSLEVALYSLLSSFAAVFALTRFSERTAMMRTVLFVGGVNVWAVLGFGLLAQPAQPWTVTGFQVVLGMFGGVQVALLASALLPPLELLFNTMTDIKLLELSNMNLPLLKQLAMRAPGTYHHSVVVGTLAEKAAEAIGANPLFTRVSAYYHDVGKMRQPEYFVENQLDGHNPHDKLSPHMSTLILVRHVKDGVSYAEQHRLPSPLIDVIPQHHGTRLIRYFFERAKQETGADAKPIREEEFRYPGPKPQTKEAALIMLADGVEAMSRLLTDPRPRRLREMIQRNVSEILEDGQLDECDITLADLAKVEEAFLEVLAGMHHHRIEYPEEPAAPDTSARAAS